MDNAGEYALGLAVVFAGVLAAKLVQDWVVDPFIIKRGWAASSQTLKMMGAPGAGGDMSKLASYTIAQRRAG